MSNAPVQTIDAGQEARQGFGEQSLARVAETASTALAAQAKAQVEARYIMAINRPRNLLQVRDRLLADCKRPAFAEAAIYRKPVGEGVEGPSVRLAEAAARAMTNIYADVAAIYDDAEKRIVRVSATDLEANVTYPMDVTIEKTIERAKPMPGRKIISSRKNSRGYDVFTIEATAEEILDKERALASKALRTCLLRLIPGDILEEAIEQCYRVREEAIRANLPAQREKMVRAYVEIGVTEQQLCEYLGHSMADVTVEEVNRMRSLFHAIKDKETTWAEALEQKRATQDPPANGGAPANGGGLSDALAKKAEAAKPAANGGAAKPETKPADAKTEPKSDAKPKQAELVDSKTGEVKAH
jgi:hypothetical protein